MKSIVKIGKGGRIALLLIAGFAYQVIMGADWMVINYYDLLRLPIPKWVFAP